jgi:hypothetical protein
MVALPSCRQAAALNKRGVPLSAPINMFDAPAAGLAPNLFRSDPMN